QGSGACADCQACRGIAGQGADAEAERAADDAAAYRAVCLVRRLAAAQRQQAETEQQEIAFHVPLQSRRGVSPRTPRVRASTMPRGFSSVKGRAAPYNAPQ